MEAPADDDESDPPQIDLGELDLTSDAVEDLTGLAEELDRLQHHEIVRDILRTEGSALRERAKAIEGKLHQARDVFIPPQKLMAVLNAAAAHGSGGAGQHPRLCHRE